MFCDGLQEVLHTPSDKLAALRLDEYYQTHRLVVGF
jgi:hypothetical protein